MPVYDYECRQCGPFTTMRPMAESDRLAQCPRCGQDAPRAFFTAPYVAAMSGERRLAHATNEQSGHAPKRFSSHSGGHGAGCNCCGRRAPRSFVSGKDGAKSFPGRRPWMISH
jgi:putative FmdB family regulatory protein